MSSFFLIPISVHLCDPRFDFDLPKSYPRSSVQIRGRKLLLFRCYNRCVPDNAKPRLTEMVKAAG